MALLLPGYDVTERLYDGKRTIVFQALRVADRLPVILKTIRDSDAGTRSAARLALEFRLLRTFTSDHVIRAHALERYQGTTALILEDYGAAALQATLARARFDVGKVLQLAIQIARGIADLHAAGIIHKDINPSNILLHPETGKVKLIDLGIASELSMEETSWVNARALEGTLPYISPEQTGRMNRPVDYRTDLYSFGITLYELLIGWRPFQATDPLELVHCHIARMPAAPHDLNAHIPAVLSELVMRLLAKTAEERYQTAFGVLHDLERCLTQWRATGDIPSFPLGSADVSDRLAIPRRLLGRAMESEALAASFAHALTGATSFVLVSGEPGMGKTSLVQDVRRTVTESGGFFLAGKFDSVKRDRPFASFVQALEEFVRHILTGSEEELALWRERIAGALQGNGGVLAQLLPDLELLLGAQPAVQDLPPVELQNRFRRVFLDFLGAIAGKDHPLLLFLDDLQWADPASVELLQKGVLDGSLRYLLMVGAMRNEEEGTTIAPLLIDAARAAGLHVSALPLAPLDTEHLATLIAETLRTTPEDVRPLASLLHAKTAGNPHFAVEFLEGLHRDELLTFDGSARRWVWDLDVIRRTGVTDNVARLLAERLDRLPAASRRTLTVAACAGERFELALVAAATGTRLDECAEHLWPAVREGILLPIGDAYKFLTPGIEGGEPVTVTTHYEDISYRFSHDRIRQAVDALLDEGTRAGFHHRLGVTLLREDPDPTSSERLFDIATHLHLGRAASTGEPARETVARLDYAAGERARTSSAFATAARYYAAGTELLEAPGPPPSPDLAFALRYGRAVCEYMRGEFVTAEREFDALLARELSPVDQARVHGARVDLFIHIGKRDRAIAAGREGLRLVGISLPKEPGALTVAREILTARWRLRGKDPGHLMELPVMTAAPPRIALRILMSLMNIAYSTSQQFSALVIATMMNLTLRWGTAPESAYAFAIYGLFVGAGFGDYRSAVAFGALSLRLAERNNDLLLRGRCSFLMACLLNHWRNPVSSNTAYLDEAYRLSTASGDLHYASYALTQQTIVAVHTGEPLDDIFKKAAGYLEFTRRIQYEDITPYFVVARQWVACLRGETVSPAGFGTTDFDDAAYRVALDASTFAAPRGWYWLMRLEAATLARNTAEAVDLIDRLHPLLYALTGQLLEADYWFYSALALCALPVPGMTPRHRKHLRTAQKKLRQWAGHCPANYQHTSLLIDAEIARRSGKSAEALAEYERSIAAAREHGFPHAEAIATEWAGRFHAAENRPAIALLYLREAHRGYRRWGATVLARRIEIELPAVREPEPSGEEQRTATQSTSTTEALQGTLDLLTVLKASQALSESIDLQRVLERMMRVVMENAGADRGLFIVEQGGALVIEAEGSLHDHALSVLQSRPVVANDWYADAVIRYVARSKAPIVLHGPVREGPFAGDPHIHPERTFSLLCTPIVRQGKLNGILYLENTLLSGAFTRERMEVLRLLSAQIAISIENARLYEQEKMLARMHEQVRLAADIQLDLLPKASPAVPGYTLAGRNLPAQLVGGDYFDYLPIDEGRIALCLGDVSGKGLPASLLMANLQATLRAQTALNDSPGSCMRRANTLLHRSTSPEKFATLFYGILDFREHTLWFSNAGHEQPMLLDGRDPLTPLDAGGPPLAMLEDYPYADGRVVLAPEALLVVYSDGVPEAMNRAGEQFGHDRLHAVIRDHSTAEPAALIEAIIEKIHDHAEGAEQSDDITLLVVRRQPAGETIADHPPR